MTFDSSFINEVPHTIRCYPAKSKIFDAGEYAKHLFVIKKGTARIWFNKDGRDCTLQFFLENEPICIYESFIDEAPSLFTIETIEPTEVLVFGKHDLLAYVKSRPELKDVITKYVIRWLDIFIYSCQCRQIHPSRGMQNL